MLKSIVKSKTKYLEIIIIFYLMLKPFYISAMPMQLADFILLGLFVYLLGYKQCDFKINTHTQNAFRSYCGLVVWSLLINFLWLIQLDFINKSRFLQSSSYLIFNGIAIYVVLMLYETLGRRLFKVFVYGALYSVILEVILSIILYNPAVDRQVVAFNNPNQLGYYAVIMLTICVVLGEFLNIWEVLLLSLCCIYLSFISLSKASIIACAGLIFLALFTVTDHNDKGFFDKRIRLLLLFLGSLYIVISMWLSLQGKTTLFGKVVNRVAGMAEESDSNLGSGRGYDRIFEMKWNILWGMGEGAYNRFSVMSGKEIHSTLVSMFVSYGIIGVAIYMVTIIQFLIVRNKMWFVLVCFSGVILYSLTHNGIRNTILWMVIALVSIFLRQDAGENENVELYGE